MKILKILRISCLPLFSLFRNVEVKPFNSITISPLYKRATSSIVVDTDSSYLSFSIFLKNDVYKNLEILTKTITKPGTYTYTYNNAQTRNRNQIYIKYKSSENGEYKTSDLQQFNIATGSSYHVSSEQSLTTVGTVGIFYSDLSFESQHVTYTFEGFDDYYSPDYFHKIDLLDFNIHSSHKCLPYINSTITLVIKTPNDVFKDIGGIDGGGRFNLNIIEQKDSFTFELANTYYVDPATLLMSKNPKNGYVQTRHIFLPVNEMQNQDKYEAYISMESFGINNDYLIYNFKICALENLIGNCTNSLYCVVRES